MNFYINVIYHAPLDLASPVSLTRRMISSNSNTQFPPKDDMTIIPSGTPYVHVTTTERWMNVDEDTYVNRVPGNVNALGKGFYTYPASLIENANGKTLSKLLQWVHFANDEDKEAIEIELREKVRIVTVSPKYNVRAWEPKKLPGGSEIDNIENELSSKNQLNFLAIIANDDSGWPEVAWLKAIVDTTIEVKEGEVFPTDLQVMAGIKVVEDELPIDWLDKNVRNLTENEINLYLKYVFGA